MYGQCIARHFSYDVNSGQLVALPDGLHCPISMDVAHSPVITVDGQLYEREQIAEWFRTRMTSPTTGQLLDSACLLPVELLKEALEAFILARPELHDTHESIAVLENVNGWIREELVKSKTIAGKLSEQVFELRDAEELLTAQVAALNGEYSQKVQQMEDLSQRLADQAESIARLEEELAASRAESCWKGQALGDLSSRLASEAARADRLERELAASSARCSQKDKECQDLARRRKYLEQEYRGITRECQDLALWLIDEEDWAACLKMDLASSRASCSKREQAFRDLSDRVAGLAQELAAARAQCGQEGQALQEVQRVAGEVARAARWKDEP